MDAPRVLALMDDYNLSIDDVRWYLSKQLAHQILSNKDRPDSLVEEIWSGRLADGLFAMEETYLAALERDWNEGKKDEAHIRASLGEIKVAQRRRIRTGP